MARKKGRSARSKVSNLDLLIASKAGFLPRRSTKNVEAQLYFGLLQELIDRQVIVKTNYFGSRESHSKLIGHENGMPLIACTRALTMSVHDGCLETGEGTTEKIFKLHVDCHKLKIFPEVSSSVATQRV